MAVEVDFSNTAKARMTAQRHTDPIDTPKLTTGHCTSLQRDAIQPHQPEHSQALPTRKTSKDINLTTSMGEDATIKNHDLENFFFFFLINHTVYSPYIFLT